MTVEAPGYIGNLNPAWPTDTDDCPEGDDHIRLVKTTLQNQFPNLGVSVAVNPTAVELNHVVGVTSGIQAQLDALSASIIPPVVGAGAIWFTAVAPALWKILDGQPWPTATYPELSALWLPVYGGSGGNFNTPNVPDRSLFSVGANWSLAEERGAETVALTKTNLPNVQIDMEFPAGDPGLGVGSIGYGSSNNPGQFRTEALGDGTPVDILSPGLGVYFMVYTGV